MELDENSTTLESDPNLKLSLYENNFKGVKNLISRPIHRVMKIQSRIVSKRTEVMKEFKIVLSLAEVLTDVPERLIHVNRISKELMRFVLMKAWPLKRMDVIHYVPDILENYEALSDAYYDDDWEEMGIQTARIAHKLHEDQKKVRGETYVNEEDEY